MITSTYGLASAQLYSGRMAAINWQFVFVDDFLGLLRVRESGVLGTATLLTLPGTPLSWKRTLMAQINTWLGFVIDPAKPTVQMARDKHLLVMQLLEDLVQGKVFTHKDIKKGLGSAPTNSCGPGR